MTNRYGIVLAAAISCLTGFPALSGGPADHLRAAVKPVFRNGHGLLPLTRWGWRMPFDANVELCRNWGYALEFGEVNARTVAALADPESEPSRLCALTAADPDTYPLSVLVHRACSDRAFTDTLPDDAWCRDRDGRFPDGKRVWSPEAPAAVFQAAGARAADPLAALRRVVPVAIALNGGEYALSVEGHHRPVWEQDPRVAAARGDTPWFAYISRAKAEQESLISDAVRQALPDRRLYIYYHTSGCPHRNRTPDWDRWAWDFADMRRVSDLPNSSVYYRHFNTGWAGDSDMLTQTLNAVGRNLTFGLPLSYDWLNGGWDREALGAEALGDPESYAGYLKCCYMTGMIGGVAGYFAYPPGGFAADTGDEVPHWLTQMMVLARVHALFSHLETFLRSGDLLPGPERHRWSADQPAFEFPASRPGARVLVRKHRERPEWLVCVWQAAGEEGPVEFTVPGLALPPLESRRSGVVYRVRSDATGLRVTRLDPDGMLPSQAVPQAD